LKNLLRHSFGIFLWLEGLPEILKQIFRYITKYKQRNHGGLQLYKTKFSDFAESMHFG